MTRPSPLPPSTRRGPGRTGLLVVLSALALLLAACGGGDDGIRFVAASSPTPEPTADETAEPTPTPVTVPERPDNPFTGGSAIAEYLLHGDADLDGCLPELVSAWEMAEIEGPRCILADIDGDGLEEFALLVSFEIEGEDAPRADVWFFDDEEGERRHYHSASVLNGGPIYDATILEVSDLSGDDLPDVAITWERCDEEDVCATRFIIASHHNGSLENLVPLSVAVDELQEIVVDAEERRIVLRGGLTEEPDAETGPLRGRMTVLTWSGSRYRATERPSDPEYLVHLLDDADHAYARGEYREARDIYESAAADATLRDWKAERGQQAARPELQAYALFRAALSAQRAGDGSAMLALLDAAADEHPQTMHGAAAVEYREALRAGQSPGGACARVEAYLGAFSDFHAQFWDYGSANSQRRIAGLCR